MRNFALILLMLFLLTPATALAGEAKSPLDHVEALAAHLDAGKANFDNTNDLYKAAKNALADDKDGKAKARYEEIRPKVAEALRRNAMPTSAWLMGVFGATLLWGGLAFCIGVARKKGGGKGDA